MTLLSLPEINLLALQHRYFRKMYETLTHGFLNGTFATTATRSNIEPDLEVWAPNLWKYCQNSFEQDSERSAMLLGLPD